ncbi:MAG: ATP synthase F1 subunit epsilon [Clostridia bacterium]|jgi:F-type H+-transporting ATPase subunit epsilon|nr:ATP synthase F1 subunit epsilon [Clostridia bacterium]MBO7397568.1 ATP synthase F1 subunit epsilon [Clostridia bacterium]MBO7503516.1 ATP synthase F1 subunit epsilon [Clostridia bacterium]MBO7657937.1 ATP synthase F1 subunit epsilon [Clostridia bacterium]MBP5665819.1 ATP synthase F1 subunit epsilon [Clostridia bacterium]
MSTFHLEIVTPDNRPFSGEAERLLVRTTEGDVEILPGHIDYLATIGIGRAKITVDKKSRLAAISGGFVSVSDKKVRLVVTTFEYADEIDVNRAIAAKKHAEELIKEAKDATEEAAAKARLLRALSRLAVASKK